MFDTLKAFWEFINGKKSVIGGAIMFLARLMDFFGVDISLTNPLSDFGMAIMTIGFAHKGVKLYQ